MSGAGSSSSVADGGEEQVAGGGNMMFADWDPFEFAELPPGTGAGAHLHSAFFDEKGR